jgi:hypothetical protein
MATTGETIKAWLLGLAVAVVSAFGSGGAGVVIGGIKDLKAALAAGCVSGVIAFFAYLAKSPMP